MPAGRIANKKSDHGWRGWRGYETYFFFSPSALSALSVVNADSGDDGLMRFEISLLASPFVESRENDTTSLRLELS
jgi:hypothetical protein